MTRTVGATAGSGSIAPRQTILAFAIRIAFVVQGFVLVVVLTRMLSPKDVGIWFSLLAISGLLTALLGQGLPFASSRSVATSPGTGRVVVLWTLRRSLAPWLLALLVLVLLSALGDAGSDDLAGTSFIVIAVATAMAGPQMLERLASEVGRGARIDTIALLGDGVFSKSLFTLLAIGLLLCGANAGLLSLLVLSQLCTIVFVLFAGRSILRHLKAVEARPAMPRGPVFTSSLWMHSLTMTFMAQGDLLIASFVLSSDQVAQYAVAWRLGTLVTLPLVALTSVVPGRIYRFMHNGDIAGMRAAMVGPLRRAGLASVALFLLLLFAGQFVLVTFFGTAYRHSYVPMVIIAAGQLVSMWAGPVGHVLIGAQRERSLVIATTTSAVALAVLAPLGARTFGDTGVALAMSASLVVGALLRNHMGQRAIGGRGVGSVWRFRTGPHTPRPASVEPVDSRSDRGPDGLDHEQERST